eukprot:GILJ01021894.1.p1 GENE.GILJ01021894.1~~GILJ01021894.1.p1  ORF type:complete len:403 (-),score=28.77 GILJ01021894.1:137-1345(-)
MAGSFLAMLTSVFSFVIEWRVLSPCLAKRLDELVAHETSMRNLSFGLGANPGDIFGSGMPALDISKNSSTPSQQNKHLRYVSGIEVAKADMDLSFGVLSMNSFAHSMGIEGGMRDFTGLAVPIPSNLPGENTQNASSGTGTIAGRSRTQTRSPQLVGLGMADSAMQSYSLGKKGSRSNIMVGGCSDNDQIIPFSALPPSSGQLKDSEDKRRGLHSPSLVGLPAGKVMIEGQAPLSPNLMGGGSPLYPSVVVRSSHTPSSSFSMVTTSLRMVSNQQSSQLNGQVRSAGESAKLYSLDGSQSPGAINSRFIKHSNIVAVEANFSHSREVPSNTRNWAGTSGSVPPPCNIFSSPPNIDSVFPTRENADPFDRPATNESYSDRSDRSETKMPSSKGSWEFDPEDYE